MGTAFSSVMGNTTSTTRRNIPSYIASNAIITMETLIKPFTGDKTTNQMGATQEGFLQAHKNLGHISYERIREMARQGDLPRGYATCKAPACAACMYAKATKRKWRHRAPNAERAPTKRILKPGECVAVDMLMSPTPGFIAQLTGRLTN